MNQSRSIAFFSLLTVLILSQLGFSTNAAAKRSTPKIADFSFEALHQERVELSNQLEAITNLKIKEVTVTAYSPTQEECGGDPLVTASMKKVRPGIIAVSRDLFDQGWVFGKKVYVKDHGIFEIADLMSKRYKKRMDIFFPDTDDAKKFGIKQQVTVALIGG